MTSPTNPRRHGFRISVMDAMVLIAGTAMILWLYRQEHPLAWIVAMALGHFFLFCNVFLVWRRWELLWALMFIVNVMAHALCGTLSAGSVLLWQLPVTLVVILWQIRSPWYHGICAVRLNPRLSDYLQSRL